MTRSVRDGLIRGRVDADWRIIFRARETGTTFYEGLLWSGDGYELRITRVVNGVHTQLGSLHNNDFTPNEAAFEIIGSTIRVAPNFGPTITITDTAIPGPGNWLVAFGTETLFENLDTVALSAAGIGHQRSYAVGGGTLNASGIGHQRSYGIGGGTVTAPTLEAAGIGHQRSYAVGTGTLNASGQGHQASYGIGGASLNAAGIGHQVSYGLWSMDTPWFPGPTRVIIEDSRTSLTIEDSRTSLTIE